MKRQGFTVANTRGSHVKLQRTLKPGVRETLTIPLHAELATGTLLAIYRQCCRYVAETKLRPHFYTETAKDGTEGSKRLK